MKLHATIFPLVLASLPQETDKKQLQEALDSYINGLKLLSEIPMQGAMKNSKKDLRSELRVSIQALYAGETNNLSGFLEWNDKIGYVDATAEGFTGSGFALKLAKIGCQLTVTDIPPHIADWLKKFAKGKAEVTTPAKANGNGHKPRSTTPAKANAIA